MRKRGKLKEEKKKTLMTVVDASGLVLGRLASHVAKRILIGENVVIINAEKAIITGSKKNIVEEFKIRLGTKTFQSQKFAPVHARRPDRYVRRVIRGMLPWKKPRGKSAYRKLKVYISVPENYKEVSTQTFLDAKKNIRPSMTVGELLKVFGWKPPTE
jgi:large subunit ribosomal protein L13